MNILITSAGRRVELVESFKDSVIKLGMLGTMEVFCADFDPTLSSACHVSKKSFQLPLADSANYISELLRVCLENEIKLVIPTNDKELLVLAKHRKYFKDKGIFLLVSDQDVVEKCRDKRLTGSIFDGLGIRYPEIYNTTDISYPCFCKPYDGSSSIGARTILTSEDVTESVLESSKNMYMELIPSSFKEYTVDAYFDKNSKLRGLVPRERLSVRAGEVAKGITRKNYVFNKLLNHAIAIPGAVGCLTIQVFGNPETEEVIGLEINPRFGGGYPLSVAAGADYSSMIIKEYLLNKEVDDCYDWRNNTLMLRYDAKVVVHDVNI